MTTYNTGNPIGSTDARDRLDNTENMDILENSTTLTEHADRLGTLRKTRKGMEDEHDAQIAAHEAEFIDRILKMAFTPSGTFTAGATLFDARQTLLWEVSQGGDGHYYSWSGSFPKVVSAGSSPSPIAAGSWVDRTDDSLRDEIRETVFQNMKRAYAEAGFNLVDGSFQIGAELSGWPDVLWDWTSGKGYQWHLDEAKTVAAGSTPASSGGVGVGAWLSVGDATLRGNLLSQNVNMGDALITVKQPFTNTAARTQHAKNSDWLSVKDFGAAGDGSTDDTTAIQNALNAVATLGKKLYVPSGVYRVSALTYQPTGQTPLVLVGDGITNTVFRKIGTSSAALLLVGKHPSPFFIKNCVIEGITFDAVDKVSCAALQMLDCWFVRLDGVVCNGGQVSLEMLTPIFVYATSVTCQNADTGLSISYWTGESFTGSQPGVIEFNNSVFQSNSLLGVKFNDGENLILSNCAIEGNGTTPGNRSHGGVYVGANVGRFMTGTVVPGLVMRDCHLESNNGYAGVAAYSGRTLLDNVFFWEGDTNTTHDFAVDGGYYTLRNCTAASPKTSNVFEGPTTGTGNLIVQCAMKNISINESRTMVMNDAALVAPYVKIGGVSGPAAALTFQNASTYWEFRQLAGSSFGLYNGTQLMNYTNSGGGFCPGADNTYDLGTLANRWRVLYAGSGAINTSDERLKEDIQEIPSAILDVWESVPVKMYKMKEDKSGKWHFGRIAQDVKVAFEKAGFDPFEFAILDHQEWDEHIDNGVTIPSGDRYGLNYAHASVLDAALAKRKK